MFDGFSMNLSTLSLLSSAKTYSVCAENPTGEKGKGGMATEGFSSSAARELGQGWKVSPCIGVEPGETVTLADIQGPGAIQHMWFADTTGRDFILRIYWDGQEQPSVLTPLSDFFGGGWGVNRDDAKGGAFPTVTSMPVVMAPNRGYNCFWVMPFARHCRITIENVGTKRGVCFYQITYTLTEIPKDAAYFHAHYRRVAPLPYGQDYVIADEIQGKGQYVGAFLYVGLNNAGGWWGEGEVKFYMDGDTDFPTICGTGTEDYFGGACNWDVNGKYTTYSAPFMGMYQVIQPDGLYASQQRFSMYRWHIMDPIRFERDLKVTIQDLGWRREGRYLVRQDDMASVAFWYQTLPTAPLMELPSVNDLEVI